MVNVGWKAMPFTRLDLPVGCRVEVGQALAPMGLQRVSLRPAQGKSRVNEIGTHSQTW